MRYPDRQDLPAIWSDNANVSGAAFRSAHILRLILKAQQGIFVSLTWPRERRITRRAEYTACYDGGERRYTKNFVVFARRSGIAGSGRLGLAVTKKCGNAVARNRIKRVLRSFFRLHQHEMPPMDIVVTPKKHLRADKFSLAFAESELLPLLGELSALVPMESSASAAPASVPGDAA